MFTFFYGFIEILETFFQSLFFSKKRSQFSFFRTLFLFF